MKITYIHQHFRTLTESGGTRSYEFARRLAQDSHDVTVIASGNRSERIKLDGFTVRYIKGSYENSHGVGRRILSFLSFMVKSTYHAMRTPADVVFATSTPLTVAVPGILATKRQKARFVFEVRDLWPEVPVNLGLLKNPILIALARRLERAAYETADEVVALSPGMAAGVIRVAPETSVEVIPNASDRTLFGPHSADRANLRKEFGWDRPVLLYAGSFGHTYLVPWMVRLASKLSEARVLILGSGAATNDARELASGLGLDPDALLPGSLPKNEVVKRVAASDITISSLLDVPDLHVNSLNKVFDSLAAGRPIVFNHGGWLSDLVISNGAGWRLNHDPDIAAQEVDELLRSPEMIERAGIRAAALAQRHFDRDSLYRDFHSVVTRSNRASKVR